MPEFIIAYHGGKQPDSPEEGARHKARWMAWIENLGEAVVNPGTPLGKSRFVNSEGVSDEGGSVPLTGFSIVKADDPEAAIEIAKQCPFVEIGTVEIAQLMKM